MEIEPLTGPLLAFTENILGNVASSMHAVLCT